MSFGINKTYIKLYRRICCDFDFCVTGSAVIDDWAGVCEDGYSQAVADYTQSAGVVL